MVSNVYKSCLEYARCIPGFVDGQKEDVPYDITNLLNSYCQAVDAKDELKKSQYMGALMIRYWHMVSVISQHNNLTALGVTTDDIAMVVYEGLERAASSRAWLDSTKIISQEDRGAEKVINRCIYTVWNNWHRDYSKNRRKIQFNTVSYDNLLSSSDGSFENVNGLSYLETEAAASKDTEVDLSRDLVQTYIKRDLIKAIILDHIMYQDSCTGSCEEINTGEVDEEGNPVTYENWTYTFSMAKLTKSIKSMKDSDFYLEYFCSVYDVDKGTALEAINTILNYKGYKLRSRIHDVLETVKQNKKEVQWLCS